MSPRSAPASTRRERNQLREPPVSRAPRQAPSALSAYGERPPGPFGGLPVSEIAIFAGAVGLIVGWFEHGGTALIVGVIVCTLGVLEVTSREHFSGYRSHTTLLAAVPAVGLEVAVVALIAPRERLLLLLVIVPVYALGFWFLRKRFRSARQARVARPPGGPARS